MSALQVENNLGFGAAIAVSTETGVQITSAAGNFSIGPFFWNDATLDFVLFGYLVITLGTGATGYTIRLRAGSQTLTGTVIKTMAVTGLVAGTQVIPLCMTDFNTQAGRTVTGAFYSLTIQQTGAPTGAGTQVDGQLIGIL